MAKKNKKLGRRGLALLLTLVMAFSLFQITALAAGELVCGKTEHSHTDECYEDRTHEHNDECYKAHEHNRRTCDRELHEHSDDCGFEIHSHSEDCYRTHEHDFGCLFGCRYDDGERYLICGKEDGQVIYTCGMGGEYEYTCTIEKDLVCKLKESYKELVCGLDEHSHSNKCYKEGDKAEHLDIHINLTAKYTVNGKTYDASVILTGADYTSGRLTITSTGNRHNITRHGDSVDAGQYRFHGTFPVGTYANPVNYTITLVKDVDFNVEGETVTLPMTFSKIVNYWTDNICESLLATRGYKNGSWAAGEFVGGHMDFKLGASEATGTTPTDPETPDEPVKYTLTVQKNVSGITLDAPKAYTFGVYNGNTKVDTVEVTIAAGGNIALGTTALDGDETYFVVEEGSPAIEGYTLSTTAAVGTANAVDGITSDRFVLSGDTSVVFTNSYKVIEQPPVEPPVPQTENWTITHNYYLNGTELEGNVSSTVEVEVGQQPEFERVYTYGDNSYTALGEAAVDAEAKTITLNYNREYTAPPSQPPVIEKDEWTIIHNYYLDGTELEGSVSFTVEVEAGQQPEFEREWYYNDEYYTALGVDHVDADAKTVTMDYTREYYALPTPALYPVSYEYTGDVPALAPVVPDTVDYEEGNEVIVAENPTLEGYTFSGWDKENFTMPAEPVVIRGSWTVIEQPPVNPPVNPEPVLYPVSYEYTGNVPENAPAVPATAEYEAGASVTVAENPTLEGYTFSGWDKENFTMPGEPVVIRGSWTAIEQPPVNPPYIPPYVPPVEPPVPPVIDLPDEEPPLVDLPDEEPPLEELPDEDVPLADVPKTGDAIAAYAILAVLSAFGLAALGISGKKLRRSK